jgi:1-acyl-sn-glycerol-3-phosphate acyltransferase
MKSGPMKAGYWLIHHLARALIRLIFGLKIEGLDNVPRSGSLIIAANHQSFLDPPLIGGTAPREIHFMAKASLFKKPVLGPLIKYLNSIPVTRSGQDLTSLRVALETLETGGAILIFPEGTRSRTELFLKATGGIGLLVRQSEAPVVPVFIQGTRGALQRIFKHRGISVYYGQPLYTANFEEQFGSGSQAYRAFGEFILGKIGELKHESHH